jgi:hypothetical protein
MRIYEIEEVPVKPAAAPEPQTSDLVHQIEDWQRRFSEVVERMKKAIEIMAEEAGMFPCEHCGALTSEVVDVAAHSDEMGSETRVYCPKCVPVACPF